MKKQTITEKRLEILHDVLKHIRAKRIIANTGLVMSFDNCSIVGDLQQILKEQSKNKNVCKVCQRGGLLYASVWRNNKLTITSNDTSGSWSLGGTAKETNNESHVKYLNKLFTIKQQRLMERAFENNYHSDYLTDDEIERCENFYNKHKDDDTKRMVAIVKNMIKNKGIFKP